MMHALLSASSAHRWLACPPSARLCESVPDTGSTFAQEGTDAHALCEYRLRKALGQDAKDPVEDLSYFNGEMSDHADSYVEFVLERLSRVKEQCPDPMVLIEQRLSFSKWVPEGFGTGDCVIAADNTLDIIDFKYGLGIEVAAKDNPQLMCYALGALYLFDGIYDVKTITMSIFQPRRSNVCSYTLSKDELLTWADTVLAPTARLAIKGEGEFCAGDHCRFCKVKGSCRKRAEYNLELARYDFAMPPELTDAEVEAILDKADSLISWAGDIKEYALQQALSGKTWQNWKVVEGRSVRKYASEAAVADKVQSAGFDPYEKKLIGITAMTKLLGRSRFDDILEGLIQKPQGKPTLVPITDKRPAMKNAANDFKEEN